MSFFLPPMFCKSKPSSNSTTTAVAARNFTDHNAKMGTATPLAIGSRGTIASLLRKEIDYFKRLDLESSKRHPEPRDLKAFRRGKPASNAKTATSSSSSSLNTTLGYFFTMGWKKKRTDNNGGSFLPSMCSSVDINEGNNRIPGFSYRSLKVDVEN